MNYSKREVDKAGNILKDKNSNLSNDIQDAEKVLTYWRTIHSSVITDFHNDLKERVEKINEKAVIVQRIKRSESIIRKLNRIEGMRLSRMQDVAGVRVILEDINEVYLLVNQLTDKSFLHEFKNQKDYIKKPKESGYRGIHLIYKYNNANEVNANGLYVEVQLRTKLQHIWATAVETMSTFLGTHLKFNEGQPKWLKYFALTSSAYSFIEKTPQIPKFEKLTEKDTFKLAVYEYNYNKINESLSAYSVAADFICKKVDNSKKYHILTIDTVKRKVNIQSFGENEIELANKNYTEIEFKHKKDETKQSVLVSSDSINSLQDGFPNYFLDIREFLNLMESIKNRLAKLSQL